MTTEQKLEWHRLNNAVRDAVEARSKFLNEVIPERIRANMVRMREQVNMRPTTDTLLNLDLIEITDGVRRAEPMPPYPIPTLNISV